MRIKSVLLFCIIVSSFVSITAAEDYQRATFSVDYTDSDSLEAKCYPSSECDYDVDFRMCGDRIDISTSNDQVYNEFGGTTSAYRYTVSGVIFPEEFACSQGDNSLYVIDASESWNYVGDIHVNPKGDMDPHKGRHLIVNMDLAGSGELRNFLLTDDHWNNPDSDPSVMVQEYTYGNSDQHVYKASDTAMTGSMLNYNLADILGQDYEDHCGSGGDRTCDVVEEGFSYIAVDSFTYGDVQSVWGIETISPVHRNGNYLPDLGGFAIGVEPEHYVENDDGDIKQKQASEKQFFICRNGATMNDGYSSTTGQVVEVDENPEPQLYKCDGSSWEPVEECNSGLDHDGDGKIDYDEDPDCDNEEHPTESMSTSCIDRIELQDIDNNEQKVALYDGEWTGDSCNYAIDDSDGQTGSAEVFQCFNETEVNNYRQDQGQIDSDQASYCNSEISQNHFEDHEFNTTFDLDGDEIDAYQMPVAEFYVSRDILPLTNDDREEAAKYVDDNGFDNKKYQTLQSAMEEYYRVVWVEVDNEPHTGDCRPLGGSLRCPSTEHHPKSYSNVNVGMEALEGYENRNPENYQSSWLVANAGETSSEILSRGDTVLDSEMFPGGFAGKCPDIEWRYSYSWKCTEYTGEETELTVSFYNVQGAGSSFEGVDAGFQLSDAQISNWRLAHPYAPPEGNTSGVEPLQANGQCWVGERNERPTDMNEVVNITSTVENEDEPLYIIGELPARDESAEFNSQRYSCLFGFTQKITDLDLVPHNSITTFIDGEPVNVETDGDGENIYTDGDGNEVTEAYLTEGSQEAGQIQIDTRTIVPTSGYNLDWLHRRSANYEQQEDQEPQIGNAELIPEGDEPWPHHLSDTTNLVTGGDEDPRHPVTVWENKD